MEIDEVILIIGIIVLVLAFGGWRLGVIDLSKSKIFHAIDTSSKTAKNVGIVEKTKTSTGSYIITVTNPPVSGQYETTDPASGIKMILTVPSVDKFSVSIIGTRGDLHTFTVQLPPGCKYYYEEYYIDSVSMKGTHVGLTLDTKVKVSFLYRVIGEDRTVIVIFKPYADFS